MSLKRQRMAAPASGCFVLENRSGADAALSLQKIWKNRISAGVNN